MGAKTQAAERPGFDTVPMGRARYGVTRFLSNCSDDSYWYLVNNWKEYNQLVVEEIPDDAIPAVVILACYARQYEVEIVDNYSGLLDLYWDNVGRLRHPDKFFASCILILDEYGRVPGEEAFESINIPNIYEELFP